MLLAAETDVGKDAAGCTNTVDAAGCSTAETDVGKDAAGCGDRCW